MQIDISICIKFILQKIHAGSKANFIIYGTLGLSVDEIWPRTNLYTILSAVFQHGHCAELGDFPRSKHKDIAKYIFSWIYVYITHTAIHIGWICRNLENMMEHFYYCYFSIICHNALLL